MDKKDKKPSAADDILSELDQFDQQQSAPLEEPIRIRVSDDRLKAFAAVAPPLETNITKDDVLAALKNAGVVYGISDEGLDEIFTYGTYNVDVVVAKGKPATDGADSRIEYKFDVSGEGKAKTQADEQGNVDLRELNLVSSVEEGAVLAVKIPAVMGEPGKNVLGEELPAKTGKDIPLPLGENVKISNDETSVLAMLEGQPILKNGKISISAVYEVKGDVNYKTGNVTFKGSVVIKGNVQPGFVVNATDEVTINGNVEKAFIEAGSDVKILGGIYGGGEGKVKAGGTVFIRSVESAIIEAGHSIVIDQSVRYSTLMAGEDIVLKNSRGSIMGGKATAGHHFDVSNLGSTAFTETVVEVGVNPKIKVAYDTINKSITDGKVQIDKVMRNIKSIKDMAAAGHALPPDKEELLKKLIPAAHKLKAEIEQNSKKLAFLQEKLKSLKAGRCRVRNVTYPGVKIFTINSSMNVQKEVNHSSFYEQNEQVMVGPY